VFWQKCRGSVKPQFNIDLLEFTEPLTSIVSRAWGKELVGWRRGGGGVR
jgi:hypothetical protein